MNVHFKLWFIPVGVFLVGAMLAPESAQAQRRRGGRPSEMAWKFVSEKYDANKDGKVTAKEYTRDEAAFKVLDRNGDGAVTPDDWQVPPSRKNRGTSEPPQKGDVAPDFNLTEVGNAEKSVRLSEFTGKKPVALIFGSCT